MGSKLKKQWTYEAEWFDRNGELVARKMVAVQTDPGTSFQMAASLARRVAMGLAALEVNAGRWQANDWKLRIYRHGNPVLFNAQGRQGQCGS